MIRAIIVDDEPLGRQRLGRLLQDHPDVAVVADVVVDVVVEWETWTANNQGPTPRLRNTQKKSNCRTLAWKFSTMVLS